MRFSEHALPFEVFISSEDEFRPKLAEVCEWLDSLGLQHKATRFGQYKKFLEKFRQADPSLQTAEQYRSSISTFLAVYSECAELVRIRNELSGIDAANFIDRLKKVTKGRPFIGASRPDPSRDFAFELGMASRFLHGGYAVDLTTLADVIAVVDDRKVFIECKRVSAPGKVEAAIRDARHQLAKRMDQQFSKRVAGLIALNISTVLRSERPDLVGATEYEIQQTHSGLISEFVTTNKRHFDGLQTKQIAGFMVEASLGGIAASTEQLSLVNVRGMKIYIGPSTTATNEALVRNVMGQLHSQMI